MASPSRISTIHSTFTRPLRSRLVQVTLVITILAIGAFLLRKPIKHAFRHVAVDASTGRFQDPEGLAIDPEGNLYVADEDRARLFMLDGTGNIVAEGSSIPGIERLTGGDSLVVLAPRHIVNIGGHHLLELVVEGNHFSLVRQIGKRGDGVGEFEDPEGLALDHASGEYYATDEE